MNSAKYAIIALIRSFKTSCQLPSDMHKSLAQALAVFDCKQTAVVTDIAIDSVTDKEITFTYIPTAYQYLIEKSFFFHIAQMTLLSRYMLKQAKTMVHSRLSPTQTTLSIKTMLLRSEVI